MPINAGRVLKGGWYLKLKNGNDKGSNGIQIQTRHHLSELWTATEDERDRTTKGSQSGDDTRNSNQTAPTEFHLCSMQRHCRFWWTRKRLGYKSKHLQMWEGPFTRMDSDIFQEFWEALRTYLFKITNNLVNKPLHVGLTFSMPQTSAHIDFVVWFTSNPSGFLLPPLQTQRSPARFPCSVSPS